MIARLQRYPDTAGVLSSITEPDEHRNRAAVRLIAGRPRVAPIGSLAAPSALVRLAAAPTRTPRSR